MNQIVNLRDFQNAAPADFGFEGSAADFLAAPRPLQIVGKSGTIDVYTHKAVVRMLDDTPTQIGIVGLDYKIVQHRDYFRAIEAELRANIRPDLARDPQVRTSVSNDGAWARREYVFPAFADALRHSEDLKTAFGYRVVAWNSLDGSSAAGLLSGLIDFYCTNGMISGSLIGKKMRRHTSGFNMPAFKAQIADGLRTAQDEVRWLETVAASKLDMARAETFLRKHFSDKKAERLLAQTQREVSVRGENNFALLSAMTFYSSHADEQAGFAVRNTGVDHTARTLHLREIEVQNAVRSADFAALLQAAA